MFGFIVSFETTPGHRDEVVSLLLSGVDRLSEVGCRQYTVAVDPSDAVTIWVTEVWESDDAHAASLQLPEVRDAINRASPMIVGSTFRVATDVAGGLGLPLSP